MNIIKEANAAPIDLGQAYGFGGIKSLGEGFGYLVAPGFTVASLALLFYFLFASVKWILSGGDKESVASARKMMTHTIVGFFLLVLMFIILQFIPESLGLGGYRIIK